MREGHREKEKERIETEKISREKVREEEGSS